MLLLSCIMTEIMTENLHPHRGDTVDEMPIAEMSALFHGRKGVLFPSACSDTELSKRTRYTQTYIQTAPRHPPPVLQTVNGES